MSLSQNIARFKGGTAAPGWHFLSQTWNWNIDVVEAEAEDRWWVLTKEKLIHQHQLPRHGGRRIVSVWSGNKPHTVRHPLQGTLHVRQLPTYTASSTPLHIILQWANWKMIVASTQSLRERESIICPLGQWQSRAGEKRLQHTDVCPRNR